MLSHKEARAFYDRLGARQDWQRFYENPAIIDLIDHAAFGDAESVFEFGCGTGRLAKLLLERYLPATAQYTAADISSTMIILAQEKLAPFGARVKVIRTEGDMKVTEPPNSFDRFISTYVFDLLPDGDIRALLNEAHRALRPGGLLSVAGLTYGDRFFARLVERLWRTLHSVRPSLVGGCRPIVLLEFLDSPKWRIRHRRVVTAFGISSEVVVAEKVFIGMEQTEPTIVTS